MGTVVDLLMTMGDLDATCPDGMDSMLVVVRR